MYKIFKKVLLKELITGIVCNVSDGCHGYNAIQDRCLHFLKCRGILKTITTMKRRCTQSEFLVERYRIPLPLMQRVDIIIPLQKEIISIITGIIF